MHYSSFAWLFFIKIYLFTMNFVRFRVSRLFCVSFLLHFVNFCRTDFYLQYLYFLEPRSIPYKNIYLIIIIFKVFAGLQKVLD